MFCNDQNVLTSRAENPWWQGNAWKTTFTGPLLCPGSWAEHLWPHPWSDALCWLSCKYLSEPLSTKLYVSLLLAGWSDVKAWARHLPWLTTPAINLSFSLFQTLVSWAIDFSCSEYIRVCCTTVLANLARSCTFNLSSPFRTPQVGIMAMAVHQGSPVHFLS